MDPGVNETPIDFASRLSTRACWDDMREFFDFYGLPVQRIIEGDPDAISSLEELARVGDGILAREAFVATGNKKCFEHKGQELVLHSLVRNRVRMCPACMSEDIEHFDYRLPARPHRRSEWIFRGVKTCARHNVALVEIGTLKKPGTTHDTTRVIADAIPRLSQLSDAAFERHPSAFEEYILKRLSDGAFGGWLGELPMYAALQLCLVAGAVAVHGPGVELESLSDDDAWECERIGYSFAVDGAPGIRQLLDELQVSMHKSQFAKGPKLLYGRLYDWLAHESMDKAYDPVREIIVEHTLDTLPFGPGDTLFGREISARRVHSIHSASVEFGLHPKRMRRLLHRANYTESGICGPVNHKVTFDAGDAGSFLGDLKDSMSLAKAREYLGVPRPHERGLLERSYIKPMITGGKRKGSHAFLKADLDAFLEQLTRNVDPELTGGENMVPFTLAAKKSCCSVMDVVALVLDGKLGRVGRDPAKSGFAAVLVDAQEVRPLVTGPDYEGHSLKEIETLLPAKTSAVKALIENGFLKTETVRNPVTKWMQPIVRHDELARFKSEYVTLFDLSREKGLHFRKVKQSLVEANVVPIADPEQIGLSLYRRSELP